MKQKTSWVTIGVFSTMLLIAFMAGCSAVSPSVKEPAGEATQPISVLPLSDKEPTDLDNSGQIQELKTELTDQIRETMEKQRQEVAHATRFDYARNWKEIDERREDAPLDGVLFRMPNTVRTVKYQRAQLNPKRLTESDLSHVSEDEVWVIVRPPVSKRRDDNHPGGGAMLACFGDDAADRKPLPLKHADVAGRISGYIATVDVTQQFHNPYAEKIEAVYVFPLPQNTAINEFIMTVGTRKIRGIIRERKQAEQIYARAKRAGHTASLLTQERPNIFTQKVANIEAGKSIDVTIHYFNTLAYKDGWYEFVFPMVVGPRFNPPHKTDGVGAVAAGKRGISGQTTEVQYLKPDERSGHDIALTVDVNAGVKIEKIDCPSHAVHKKKHGPETATVTLSSRDSIPNKDFILRYKVAGTKLKHSFISHAAQDGNYFTLMLYPPEDLDNSCRVLMEMIFVIDCSGSMSGRPIAMAKAAAKRAIKKLGPNDTFQVIRFSSDASQLGAYPVLATPENIRRGLRYIDDLDSGGGTMMVEGIKAALDFPHDPTRLRLVSFMTDGYIGNEAEILAAIHGRLGSSRIFSFGVGDSVNRYLLDRMAKLGRGAVAYIGLDDSAARAIDLFYDRVRHPALMDVSIDWGGLQVSDVYPSRIPDIFPGRPIILTGRYASNAPTDIRITGKVGDVYRQRTIPVLNDEAYRGHDGVRFVWARKRIEELNSRSTYDSNPELKNEIRNVALRYGLMSAYTAFLAVDSSTRTAGDHGVTVTVPVPVPDGVRYETTVQN